MGRHAVAALADSGWQVRVLVRSEPAHPLWQHTRCEVVLGSLDDRSALTRLVRGADAVLHLAGAIKARDDAEFLRINRDGTQHLAEAILKSAPAAHMLHVSSLAAREPQLSGYGASKRAGEDAALSILGGSRVSVLRPPAVYGPGDRETLAFFQLARLPLVPLLGRDSARIAVIHVEDLAHALAEQLAGTPSGTVQSVADERPAGYRWREILGAAAQAVGNHRPRFVEPPRSLLRGAGNLVGLAAKVTGQAAMFNPGKLRELLHEEWSVPADSLLTVTPARFTLPHGFKTTADWYRREGWL